MDNITVRLAREVMGWTQVELDRRAGLRKGTIQDLERRGGDNPSHETVTRIVYAFREAGWTGLTGEHFFPVPVGQVRESA